MPRRYNRTASTLITLFGSITNAILTIQVLAAWRTLKGEQESEWDSMGDKWQMTSVQFICALLALYFASSSAVSAVGLHGILKHKSSHVRFYRDYSIADFSVCTFATLLAAYASFLHPARTTMCETFSHNPELLRDVLEMGLSLENCEQWLERGIFAGVVVLFVIMVIRLHFLLAVSHYYSQLSRHQHHRTPSHAHSHSHSHSSSFSSRSHAMQRVYVLPNTTSTDLENPQTEMVFVAVPRHTISEAQQLQATEAWMSVPASNKDTCAVPESRHHRHHSYGHGRRRSASQETTGRIKLDITSEEGLLPAYERKA
jgi:hypothetical protein